MKFNGTSCKQTGLFYTTDSGGLTSATPYSYRDPPVGIKISNYLLYLVDVKKYILLGALFFFFTTSNAQVVNGSFENASGPDISNWSWTCAAVLANTAPPSGGNWSLFVEGGNTQGCFPGYAYQKIPGIISGQAYILSGWAQASSPQMTGHHVGIYFGTINNGSITLQDGDTTSATSWTPLSVQSSYTLNAGDTAVVVLFGGLVGGPLQANGIFDLIELQLHTGIDELETESSILLFPNPAVSQVVLQSDKYLFNAKCSLFDVYGKRVKEINAINGKLYTFSVSKLAAGMYSLYLTRDTERIANKKLVIVK